MATVKEDKKRNKMDEEEKQLRTRAAWRTQFTKNANKYYEEDADKKIVYYNLKNIHEKLENANIAFQSLILDRPNFEQSMMEKDIEDAEKYTIKWLKIKNDFEQSSSETKSSNLKQIKLPRIDIPKFNGELKDWLPFWSQFKKIHESDIEEENKFVYLVQSVSIDSEAKSLVNSYPITKENYAKCIEHLQSRYGREDLQIQLYVRELLALVLQKATGDGVELSVLYDKLSAHLRALETLGVTKNHAAFLLPLVESSLPQEILKTWQRAKNSTNIEEELNNLLKFLQREVENEQRVKMANTFSENNKITKEFPTASCLTTMVEEKKNGCLWCDKENHSSIECYKLQKLSVDQRKDIIVKKKACTICLKKGHFWKNCRASVRCLICNKRHSTVICTASQSTKQNPDRTYQPSPPEEKTTAAATSSTQGTTLLQTVMVEIQYKGKKIKTRALFDSGSQKTYIRQDIIEELQIPSVKEEALTHNLFGGLQTTSQVHKSYDITVQSLDGTFKMEMEALGRSCVCTNVPSFNSKDTTISYMLKSHNISLTDKGDSTDIGLLIGADFLGLLMTGTIIQLQNGLVAIKTKLGWTLQGKQVGVYNNVTISMFCSELTGYWSLETLGIQDPVETKTKAAVAEEVLASFNESVKINEENRYEVQLPFKVGQEDLLSNYERAKQRLDSTTKKLVSGGKFKEYHEVFKEWHETGIIEKVPSSQVDHDTSHYLPHRAVIKESSLTSSLRPVFDASAKDKNGLCLNACLEKGTNLIDLIPNLLIGFRTGAIGITADIQKAFLQIGIPPADRNYLKFLWWENEECNKVIVYRHCRVVFGLTCSPFLLSATLIHYLSNITGTYQQSAQLLKKSWYVDNCITSLDTEEETRKFMEESKLIMNEAKFNLRMWVTAPLEINETGKDIVPVLGLSWDTKSDQLYCSNMENLPGSEDIKQLTKRDLLSLTQKVFDPIGFTSPVMLTPKLILQETWKNNMSWDSPLDSNLMKKFHEWYNTFHYLKNCKIPRRLTEDKMKECEVSLHLFCDASKDGYAAGVLLRAEKDKKVTTQLISAKSRVTPPKKISIPRLELLAALIGARLLTQVRENLSLQNCSEYCWTDSAVTLCWIKRELPLNTFVGNRIKEIRQHTNINNWRHIPGEHNWADLASRGCNAKTLLETRWWEGPAWLHLEPEQWPTSNFTVDEQQVHLETKKVVSNIQVCCNESLINKIQYFSKYSKIIRMVAWMLRFIYNTQHSQNKRKGEITYNEYNNAEKMIVKLIQNESSEINKKRSEHLTQYLDKEGLIRIKTKLTISDFPETTKAPYLLWANNPIVTAMVRQRHEQLQHVGSNQLITDLRARFWIIGIRRLVKTIIAICVICKRHRAKASRAPTAPLPPERTSCAAPFRTTGVDLAGPLFLRNGEKCWIVIYTCAVYRAVHLELTRSLSTEAFIMTLRRFVARRGRPDLMMSDQGTNFCGTKNLILSLDWEEVQRNSTVRRISWKMNAPSAAWWGGYWERLIRIMKDLLRRILGKSTVSYEELVTLLCECEAIMNGRPLTYINEDKNNNLEPLTPAHFIQPSCNTEMSDFDQIDKESLNRRLKYLQELKEQFRSRFKNEYLTLLVQKGKEIKDSVNIGDIVLIETEEKRIKWPLGIVLDLFTGRDGVDRTARVRTATGTKIRPIQRLYKLEVSSFTGDNVSLSQNPISSPLEDNSPEISHLSPEKSVAPYTKSRSGRIIKMPSKYDIYT